MATIIMLGLDRGGCC